MTNDDIIKVLRLASSALKHELDEDLLRSLEYNRRNYNEEEFPELKRDLNEAARNTNLLVMEYSRPQSLLLQFVKESSEVVLLFEKRREGLAPMLLRSHKGKIINIETERVVVADEINMSGHWLEDERGGVVAFVIIPFNSFVTGYQPKPGEHFHPVRRLLRLLGTEKKEVAYILVYALFIGLVSLMLPLGLQTTVELISGGVFFSSVYILIGLVIFGVLVTGILQIVQVSLVEHVQRRIFAKAAFEFAFRIPRIRTEALLTNYTPELVNRFFDVITIQKGLPKLLIDLSSASIQIFFGVFLLSLYHPFFVFFSLFLVVVLFFILYFTGPKGLQSSLNESKYKYKVVQWLEEVARAINSFKLTGNTDLPVRRTDHTLSNYLKYRRKHFGVLITQLSSFVMFKVAVTGGLLVVGTLLVVDRQINLGQFVASEVIIILVLNAVEKIIMYTEVVYDMLTAVDKVSHLTDLPLERVGGFDFPRQDSAKGYGISISNLNYQFKGANQPVLSDVNLTVNPKERVCLAGPGGSGKTVLMNIISGLYTEFTGRVAINNYSIRDLDLVHLRDKVARNISQEDIFDGTLFDNITLGKSNTSPDDAIRALDMVGLKEAVDELPDGMLTHVVSGGKGLSETMVHKMILARCIAKKPELLILNDFFSGLSKADKLHLIRCVINPESTWTLVAVSNDPLVMASCDRVVIIDEGRIVADDSYSALVKQGFIAKYFE